MPLITCQLAQVCRRAGFRCELYFDPVKLKKQFSYANQKHIPLVLLIGPEEAASGTVQCKVMKTGEQLAVSFNTIVELIASKLADPGNASQRN